MKTGDAVEVLGTVWKVVPNGVYVKFMLDDEGKHVVGPFLFDSGVRPAPSPSEQPAIPNSTIPTPLLNFAVKAAGGKE
jgi:hypothetical protein